MAMHDGRRKRTKKNNVMVGRKKSKGTEAETSTPRSRAALAREVAAKARREAEEAEQKAQAAREALQAAAREAARNELVQMAGSSTQDDVLDIMALEVQLSEPATPARRTLFVVPEDAQASVVQPAEKMTPRKKQLASKVKKTKGGKGN